MFNLNISAKTMQKLVDDGTLTKILEACTHGDSKMEAKEEKPKNKTAKKPKKEVPVTEELPWDTTVPDRSEIRDLLRKNVRKHRDEIKALISSYGVEAFSDLSDEDLPGFYEKLKEVVNEAA